MATEWQKSCIRAICSSPEHYRLFKKKQYNKRLLKQFESRLFPFFIEKKRIETYGDKKIIKDFECMYTFNHSNITDFHLESCKLILNKPVLITEELLNKIKHLYAPIDGGSNYVELFICENIFRNLSTDCLPDVSSSRNFYDCLKNRGPNAGILGFRCYSSASKAKEFKQIFIEFLSIILNSKPITKQKNSIKRMNFGIEIEYEGRRFDKNYLKKMESLGAVDFISGVDGHDGWVTPDDRTFGRLNENRLRIDGVKGLPALYTHIQDLLEAGCHIPNSGSIHVHVDCNYDIHLRRGEHKVSFYETNKNNFHKLEIANLLQKVFGANSSTLLDNIRIDYSFNTIEWRFATPCLNYSILVAEMMIFSHITQCWKVHCPINVDLLSAIVEVHQEFKEQQ